MSTAVSAPPRGPKPMTEDSKGLIEQTLLYVIVILPFLALLGAIAVAWGWGHQLGRRRPRGRLLPGLRAGRDGRLPPLLHPRRVQGAALAAPDLAVAGSLSVEGGVIRWVADHRRHHAFCDKEGDPHSPWRYGETVPALLKGFWFAHVGWLFDASTPTSSGSPRTCWRTRRS